MKKTERNLIPLAYMGPVRAVTPVFRLGVISISMSTLQVVDGLAVGILTDRRMISPSLNNLLLAACIFLSIAGFGFGIGGLFQRNSRFVAILGILLSFCGPVLIPMFMVA